MQDGGVDEVELGAVEQHQRDAVAALDPEPREPAGERLDPLRVLAPGDGDLVAGIAERDLVRPLGRGGLERVAERRGVERRGARRGGGRGRVEIHGATLSQRTAATQDEPALGQRGELVLEAREVPLQQRVERAPGRALAAHPALEHRRAGLLLRVGEQVEQDRQLGPVVEVAADDLERVGVEHHEQLVVVQPQQLLEAGGAQNSWFSPPNTSDTESSVKMRRIESVSRSAHESTRTLGGASGRIGIVSVTTTCSKFADARFAAVTSLNTAWVAAA